MRFILFLALIGLPLTGCGVKPGQVDSPSGEETGFPRTYPDASTDGEY